MSLQGRVLKNYNGYYYVDCGGQTYTCRLKGRLKQNRFSLATGDLVTFERVQTDGGLREGMLTGILPRKNFLLRPAIANLDLLVLTFACVSPDFSFLIADKLIATAERAGVPLILVLNKCDLASEEHTAAIKTVYESIGYEVYVTAAKKNTGISSLRERLRGRICAFGGPSGAGKSSTINAIDGGVLLRTGEVSEKIGRGRHTTRYAQLLPFDEGFIADTPGFGNVLMEGWQEEELTRCFREFAAFENGCRYRPCTHTHEPVCGVKEAAAQGRIAASRYESYKSILKEIKELQGKEGKRS